MADAHDPARLESLRYKPTTPADMFAPPKRWEDSDSPTNYPLTYLAGPMRHIEAFNFPAFDAAAADLRQRGFAVTSPAEHDRENGFDETAGSLDGFDLQAAMRWDLEQVLACDLVVVLPGWEHSEGVAAELTVARATGKPALSYPDLEPLDYSQLAIKQRDLPSETRYTDPTTGGQKGQKLAQLGAVDPLALMELAKVAGFGTEKYDRYNFLKGYRWSLSYDALQRHLHAFWSGENYDSESGLPHVAHAGWHCLTLLAFAMRDLGTDDRPLQLKYDAGMGAV